MRDDISVLIVSWSAQVDFSEANAQCCEDMQLEYIAGGKSFGPKYVQ